MGFKSEQIQILTPINKRELGSRNLNAIIQQNLNPAAGSKGEIISHGIIFREGDRVMQILNNYDKNIFNGEMGVIKTIEKHKNPPKSKKLYTTKISVLFERSSECIVYIESELDQLVLAYAVTVHKSQGNEFPVIIIPIHMQHRRMLQRNLIYTAVTRGKKLVILVGEISALRTAIDTINAQGVSRFSNLIDVIKTFDEASLQEYWKELEEKENLLSIESVETVLDEDAE